MLYTRWFDVKTQNHKRNWVGVEPTYYYVVYSTMLFLILFSCSSTYPLKMMKEVTVAALVILALSSTFASPLIESQVWSTTR